MSPPPIRSESAALVRVEKQLDDLQRTVNDLSTFVQSKISTLDSAVEQAAIASRRWWDVQWPHHERHHEELLKRLGLIESALVASNENRAAIIKHEERLDELEALKQRGEGAAWAGRALTMGGAGLIAAGSAILTYLLSHGWHP